MITLRAIVIRCTVLFSGEFERAAGGSLTPRSGDGPMIAAEILQLAIRGYMNHLSRGVLHIGFEAHVPVGHIHGNDGGAGIGTWVQNSLNLLAVPRHHHRHRSPLRGIGPPIAVPRAGERMSLLREIRRGNAEACKQETEAQC